MNFVVTRLKMPEPIYKKLNSIAKQISGVQGNEFCGPNQYTPSELLDVFLKYFNTKVTNIHQGVKRDKDDIPSKRKKILNLI